MATASYSDKESPSGSDIYITSNYESDSDKSDVEAERQIHQKEPCKYYNSGGCHAGPSCPYRHVCKYALKGNCRYGSRCKLNHPRAGRGSSRSRHGDTDRSMSREMKLADGRHFQWQLNDGNDWMDIFEDHIIEAQYSLPHISGIKLYNTVYGALFIDLKRMRVTGKRLRVRRLDDGNTHWIWYCAYHQKWIMYGDKHKKGISTPIKSSEIEKEFQINPRGSFTFNMDDETFQIIFKDMRQVSAKTKRKVTRRPMYRQKLSGEGASQTALALQHLSMDSAILTWQFEGDGAAWHEYGRKKRGTATECSVSSDEIERKYQQNPHGRMTFKVNGTSYELDFGAMTQINLMTKRRRRIRRVLV